MERDSGYFLVYRKIWKHKVFKNLKQSAIWLYMISQATHKDKTLLFLDNRIFVKRSELVFPLRKNAEIWGITYSEMRTFIKRLKNRKMISTRLHHLLPTSAHPSRKLTIISIINYDKFQYVDNQQSHINHISQQGLNNKSNTQLLNIGSSKDKVVNNGYKTVGDWGQHTILEKDGKRYLKHKWKNEPLKEYK